MFMYSNANTLPEGCAMITEVAAAIDVEELWQHLKRYETHCYLMYTVVMCILNSDTKLS